MIFFGYDGIVHNLDSNIVNSMVEFNEMREHQISIARETSLKTEKNVFYFLVSYSEDGEFQSGRYFCIPITEKDMETINAQFNDGYYVGIYYFHEPYKIPGKCAPPIDEKKARKEEKKARREEQKAARRERYKERSGILKINMDSLSGREFEKYCTRILMLNGYHIVQTTQASGDQGIDIIASKDGKKYGIQCKRYSSNVGNHAIQEAYAGKVFYKCDVAVVMTNQHFTKSAIELAKKTGVKLWDRDTIKGML